jgi:hypothetical protein
MSAIVLCGRTLCAMTLLALVDEYATCGLRIP